MIAALAFGIGLAFCAAAALAWAPRAAAASRSRNAARIDALLPQTQCGQCGYPGCRPYAEAVARGDAAINRCPPGGAAVIRAMADMLGVDFLPLDPACGTATPPQTVVIDEDVCIGCTKCLRVCPVDAIVGAPKLMHTVIAAQCTGCGLCIPPCPVDCIEIVPQQRGEWRWPRPLP